MFRQFRLTSANFQQSIHVDFDAAYMTVENPTGSPVFIRLGARDFPSQSDADIIIPAARDKSFSVTGHDFAAVIAAPALVTGGTSTVISGLFQVAIVTLYDATEKIPAFGDASFLSLSTSDLTQGFLPFTPGTSQIFDLRAWGGAIFLIIPDTSSDQGIVTIDVSPQSTFNTPSQIGVIWTSALWPGTPTTIIVPRVSGFMRVTFTDSGIGVAAFSGTYAVRATIAEVLEPEYIPGTNVLSQVLNVPNLGEQDFIFCTLNVPAISVSVNNNAGVRNGETVIETSDSVAGPWHLVTFTEQKLDTTFYTAIYQTIGDLGAFTRVRVLEIKNTGAITGTITASIRREPDLNGVLKGLYGNIGGPYETVQANQSVFSLLESTTGWLNLINTALAALGAGNLTTITTATNTWLSSINTALGAGNLTTLLTTISNTISSINLALGANIGANIASILTAANNIYTSIGASVGSTLNTISTNIASLVTSQTRGGGVYGGTFNITTLLFQDLGTNIGTQAYLHAISLEWIVPANGLAGNGVLNVAIGGAGGAVQTIYSCVIDGKASGKGPPLNTASIRTPGISMAPSQLHFWLQSPIQPLTISAVFYYST